MAWRFASRALASGRCADDDWVDSGARTSVLAAVTSSPARAVVADKRTKAIRKNLRIVASIDDGDSLSYPGMKLCDLGHPSLPPRDDVVHHRGSRYPFANPAALRFRWAAGYDPDGRKGI